MSHTQHNLKYLSSYIYILFDPEYIPVIHDSFREFKSKKILINATPHYYHIDDND